MGRETLAALLIWTCLAVASEMADAQTESDAEVCERALLTIPDMVNSPFFDTLKDDERVGLLSLWSVCAIASNDLRALYEASGRLAPIAPEPDSPYQNRVILALRFGEVQEAVNAFNAWSEVSPDGLLSLGPSTIASLLRQATTLPNSDEIVFDTHEVLARIGYTSPGPFGSDAYLRVEHARLLAERGRYDDAARRLSDPRELAFSTLVVLAADRVFDPLLAEYKPIDFIAEAERRIERARKLVVEYPRLVEARYRYILALRDAGQDVPALEEADRVLAEVAVSPDAFDDTEEFINWIHNDRAYALYALGERAQGRAAMEIASLATEKGNLNVSQVINRGMLLADEGRWEEALDVLGQMGQASRVGEMFAATVRVCSNAEAGDKEKLGADLAFLRANAAENYAALQQALVCANELDEAAELYVRRLADPSARDGALLAVQRWAPDPAGLQFRDEMIRRLGIVQNSSEVRVALAAVGYSQDIPLPLAYWGQRF